MPHYGMLFFCEDAHRLELRSKPGEEEGIKNEKTKKIIDLKGKYLVCTALSVFFVLHEYFARDEFPKIGTCVFVRIPHTSLNSPKLCLRSGNRVS